ncbi:MAG: glycosyltransferase [Nocardiaceae bacterium]|nr:glycosyltransferase [Nocardiaceae bacterium]
MRVLFAAAGKQYGGISTYINNLLERWPLDYPDDELHVIMPGGGQEWRGCTTYDIPVGRPDILWRPLATSAAVRRLCNELRPDVFVALLPSTTLLKPSVPTAVVIYDLRHELRPDHFGRARRLLRRVSYRRGYRAADAFISISQRSLDDLNQLHPYTRSRMSGVVYLGADHVDNWPPPTESGTPYALAFGHHSNKNVSMLLEAWQDLIERPGSSSVKIPELVIVGVSGEARPALQADIEERGLTDSVRICRFLPDAEFQQMMTGAQMVVFPSEFEGFGLPVPEAMRLGIPVVFGPDPAVVEVSGGHGVLMAEFSATALAAAVLKALDATQTDLDAARSYASKFEWSDTTRRTREMLVALQRGHSSEPSSADLADSTHHHVES